MDFSGDNLYGIPLPVLSKLAQTWPVILYACFHGTNVCNCLRAFSAHHPDNSTKHKQINT